jgi:hypothetical protein
MPEFKITTVNKAKAIISSEKTEKRKKRRKSSIIEEYEKYLRNLERGKAIAIELKDGDKFQTIKYRLKAAAVSLGMKNLKIERAGDKAVVYREVRGRVKEWGGGVRGGGPVEERAGDELIPGETACEAFAEGEVAGDELSGEVSQLPPAGGAGVPELAAVDMPDTGSAPALTQAAPEDESLALDDEWQEPMIRGRKTCEARDYRFDGGVFEAFGDEYIIRKVEQLPLGDIADEWFREHGCYSPREFRELWKQSHRGAFDPEQKVWLHHFKKAFEGPVQPDSEGHAE